MEVDEGEHNTVTGNPVGEGYRVCGACRAYVIACRHRAGPSEQVRKTQTKAAHVDSPAVLARRKALLRGLT